MTRPRGQGVDRTRERRIAPGANDYDLAWFGLNVSTLTAVALTNIMKLSSFSLLTISLADFPASACHALGSDLYMETLVTRPFRTSGFARRSGRQLPCDGFPFIVAPIHVCGEQNRTVPCCLHFAMKRVGNTPFSCSGVPAIDAGTSFNNDGVPSFVIDDHVLFLLFGNGAADHHGRRRCDLFLAVTLVLDQCLTGGDPVVVKRH
jgi:hypothetical protein